MEDLGGEYGFYWLGALNGQHHRNANINRPEIHRRPLTTRPWSEKDGVRNNMIGAYRRPKRWVLDQCAATSERATPLAVAISMRRHLGVCSGLFLDGARHGPMGNLGSMGAAKTTWEPTYVAAYSTDHDHHHASISRDSSRKPCKKIAKI